MPYISLKDILINARQESVQMRHHYLGVEHLFIAMLQIQGGLAASILEDFGLSADYVIDAIRRKTERGTAQRLWAGFPYTPRVDVVMDIANDLALDSGEEITERELFEAILIEGDSLPIRVLSRLGVNLEKLHEAAQTYTPNRNPHPPDIRVEFSEYFGRSQAIQSEHLFLLRRMFSNYNGIRIEQQLTGFSGAVVLVVTPIQADGREDAPVVVKIDQADMIQDEVQRFDAHVRSALPLQTARIEEPPTMPESFELAGLKYTLVANTGSIPQDLRQHVQANGIGGITKLLRKDLYEPFRKTWWAQRRLFRFQAWQEYDWLLPPLLILDLPVDHEPLDTAHTLKTPINRVKLKARMQSMEFSDTVILENFTVQRVDRQHSLLKLAAGYGSEADKRAYKVEVRGVNRLARTFYRGEVLDRFVGSVWKTRQDILLEAVNNLEGNFSPQAPTIQAGGMEIPNPLAHYEDLLDRHVNGSMSKIHGDLHLGNILVGPNDSVWLIDFGHTRDGHTLCDWATLTVSILGDGVMPSLGHSWDEAGLILQAMAALGGHVPMPNGSQTRVNDAIQVLGAIREIVQECLTSPGEWQEYWVALALCALRATTWKAMTLGGRRLMFLLSGLSILEITRHLAGGGGETPSPDQADLTDRLPIRVSRSEQAGEES